MHIKSGKMKSEFVDYFAFKNIFSFVRTSHFFSYHLHIAFYKLKLKIYSILNNLSLVKVILL